MRLIAIALICLSVAGCLTVKPDVKRKMEAIQIPHADFRQADVADVIAFLVEQSREFDPASKRTIHLSLIPDQATQERDKKEHDRKYRELKDYCKGKTISLNLENCSILILFDFVTRYAGVEYEFIGERIVLRAADGDVLVNE